MPTLSTSSKTNRRSIIYGIVLKRTTHWHLKLEILPVSALRFGIALCATIQDQDIITREGDSLYGQCDKPLAAQGTAQPKDQTGSIWF